MSTALNLFHDDELAVIKSAIAVGCTDAELALFAHACKRTGLDPFSRQIYAIKRQSKDQRTGQWTEKMTIQTSIDGYRVIAERTKKYRGQMPILYCGHDGNWTDVWLQKTPPAAAKVSVLRTGFTEPMTAVALWTDYVQKNKDGTPSAMWAKMPCVMLAKVAEAQALRKAFPNDLSGIYTTDEMHQADEPARDVRAENFQPQPTPQPTGDGANSPTPKLAHNRTTATDRIEIAATAVAEIRDKPQREKTTHEKLSTRLFLTGAALYGGDWDTVRHATASALTQGTSTSSTAISDDDKGAWLKEMDETIAAIKARFESATLISDDMKSAKIMNGLHTRLGSWLAVEDLIRFVDDNDLRLNANSAKGILTQYQDMIAAI